MKSVYIALVCLCMQAVVFAQPCNALIYKNKDAVAFDGCISTQSVNVLLEALYNKDVKVLLMRSTGGSAPDSFSLAKRIRELRLTLVLRGNCYSACSTYILPAAESVIVEEGTLILFHGDARIGVAMNEEAIKKMGETARQGIAEVVASEVALSTKVPQIETIHQMQKVMSADKSRHIDIIKDKHILTCAGLGEVTWAATLEWLISARLITKISQKEAALFPEVPSTFSDPGTHYITVNSDPFASCKVKL